jgi:hypothetical protein
MTPHDKPDTPDMARLSIPGYLCVTCDTPMTQELKCPGCGWIDPQTRRPDKPDTGADGQGMDEILSSFARYIRHHEKTGLWDGENLTQPKAKAAILAAVMRAKPAEIDEGDGWDIYFTQADIKDIDGNIVDKGKVRSCCPGDDIAYAHNTAVKEFEQNIRKEFGV